MKLVELDKLKAQIEEEFVCWSFEGRRGIKELDDSRRKQAVGHFVRSREHGRKVIALLKKWRVESMKEGHGR